MPKTRSLGTSRRILRLALGAAVALAGQGLFSPSEARAASDVVISQVYGGGGNSGATYTNDFIELFNRGSVPVSLAGWSVQYGSSGGTTWSNKTDLAGTIQPGQYYLVQEAAGAGGTTPLPAPDATGSINMSGTAGKVALVDSTTFLTGSGCPLAASVVDFVGYGGANCSEGSPAPGLSNTTAALRNGSGCADSDNNSADFASGPPTPRNTSAPLGSCLLPTPPSIAATGANPNPVLAGSSTLLTATVSLGTNPASTGLAVTADLSAIGGSAAQAFFDDGSNGDLTGGDDTFSFLLGVPPATPAGAASLPATVTDAQARSGSGAISLTVITPAAQPKVVISQVYGGGGNSGATLRNDFIELFNRDSVPVDLTGWSVQYASSGGTSWSNKTDLSGVLQPGQHYLIQEAAGAGGTTNLPTPDVTGTINMSGTTGKVALVNSTTALTGGCPAVGVVDFVGYGSSATTTNFCYEGAGPTAALSNTTAALRLNAGCVDTDQNASDFFTAAPLPRNTAWPITDCSAPPSAVIPIHEIQGSGPTSPLVGQGVTTLAVVTGRKSNGFFLQMPDAEADADPATSEGIFVFTGGLPPTAAAVGNEVLASGTVQEFVPSADLGSPPTTEIVGPSVTLYSAGNALPAPVVLGAEPSAGGPIDQLERYEGMRVSVASLTVVGPTQGSINEPNATSTSNGVFYGVLTGTARPFREPGIETPDVAPACSLPPCSIPVFDANPERIRVDSDAQPGASTIEVTAGAVVTGLVGPLDYGFRAYTIDPDPGIAIGVSGNVAATPVSLPAADQFTIASFNMQRFFNDDAAEPGPSVPVLTPAAFQNRLNKASLGIRDVMRSPDIIGVEEVENLATLQSVADRVNADALAAGDPDPSYEAYLVEGNDVGGIDSGFLVKGARVSVVGVTQEGKDTTYINPVDGLPALLNDRPPLVLRATVARPVGPAYPVTVIVNHLRSLSDVELPDGRVRAKRAAQAEFLANLIQARQGADPQEHIVSLGDYNAFQFNDGYGDSIGTVKGTPAPPNEVVLASPDLVDPDLVVLDAASSDQQYSYVFDGNAQELDHILITQNLLPRFDALEYGRVGADFPDTYRNDPLRPERLSDHDPAVAYFSLPPDTPPVADAGPDAGYAADGACQATVPLDGSGSFDADGDSLSYTWTGPFGTATGVAPSVSLGLGAHDVTLTVDDGRGGSSSDVVRVTVSDATPPVITLLGANPLQHEAGTPFSAPGATASDNCGGDLTGAIATASNVNPDAVGSYSIVYAVSDPSGNAASASRSVHVVDTTPPAIVCPAPVSLDATGPSGATATFVATASDSLPGVSVVCVPASGSTFAFGVTPVVCTATDAAGNRASCGFSVTVRAPRSVTRSVLADLVALRATVHDDRDDDRHGGDGRDRDGKDRDGKDRDGKDRDGKDRDGKDRDGKDRDGKDRDGRDGDHDGDKLDDAIAHLRKALDADLWLDDAHPHPKRGEKVFDETQDSVKTLQQLIKDKRSKLPDATLQGFIVRLVAADRLIARLAIADAVARGADARKIAKAKAELADGDADASAGRGDKAIEEYAGAWKQALKA